MTEPKIYAILHLINRERRTTEMTGMKSMMVMMMRGTAFDVI